MESGNQTYSAFSEEGHCDGLNGEGELDFGEHVSVLGKDAVDVLHILKCA